MDFEETGDEEHIFETVVKVCLDADNTMLLFLLLLLQNIFHPYC
jgi:hypothetical protein